MLRLNGVCVCILISNRHTSMPSAHGLNDHRMQTSNISTMVVDFSSSGVPLPPLLPPPTLGSISGRMTSHVNETAINYSLPRTTSGADNLPKTGNGIPTLKRPRPEVDEDHYESREPVCTSGVNYQPRAARVVLFSVTSVCEFVCLSVCLSAR